MLMVNVVRSLEIMLQNWEQKMGVNLHFAWAAVFPDLAHFRHLGNIL